MQSLPIDSVEVFPGHARVQRTMNVDSGNQQREILIVDISDQTIVDSVSAIGDENVSVQSIEVLDATDLPLADEVKAQIQSHKAELELLEKDERTIQQRVVVIKQDMASLESMVKFSGGHFTDQWKQGNFDVDGFSQLADFSFSKRRELAKELFTAEEDLKDKQSEIKTAQHKHNILRAQIENRRPAMLLRLRLQNASVGGSVRLQYNVASCGWSTSYIIRGNADKDEIQIQWIANVLQASGETWQCDKFAFNQTSSSESAQPPRLMPLRVSSVLDSEAVLPNLINASVDDELGAETGGDGGMAFGGSGLGGFSFGGAPIGADGDAALEFQSRDLARQQNYDASVKQLRQLKNDIVADRTLANDALDHNAFQRVPLDREIMLAGNGVLQPIVLANLTVASPMVHHATPLLSSFAHRVATPYNQTGISLPTGPATVFLNGQMVGKMVLPATAAGQRLQIGFGVNRSVRIRRELMQRQQKMNGGNQKTTYSYRLVVNNFTDDSIDMRLFDRLPIAAERDRVTIQLAEESESRISDDPLYRRMRRPEGVLRFDHSVPRQLHGSTAFDVHYQFTVECADGEVL
ncbi:MAG: DUF4139 domain-containing protein, partial [Planctomycetota bacterium]